MQFFQTLQASHTHLIWAPLLLQNIRAHADRTNTLYEVGEISVSWAKPLLERTEVWFLLNNTN